MYYNNGQYELYHFGVKGMKWGVRKRRDVSAVGRAKMAYKQDIRAAKQKQKEAMNTPEAKAERVKTIKKGLKIGAAAAGTALAVYGAYKLNKFVKTKNCQIAAQRGYEVAESTFQKMTAPWAYDNFKSGKSTSIMVSAGSGREALSSARSAKKQNFATAAKNVINYKKQGGNLRYLRNLESYLNDTGSRIELRR